jgi:hypothetical protein
MILQNTKSALPCFILGPPSTLTSPTLDCRPSPSFCSSKMGYFCLLQSNKRDVWLQAMLWPWLTTDGCICHFKVRVWIGLSSSSIANPPCPNWTVDGKTTQTQCYKQDKLKVIYDANIQQTHQVEKSPLQRSESM